MFNALGYLLAGFCIVGLIYNPALIALGGIAVMAICTVMLPITITIWVIQQLIKEFKA